MIVYKGFNADMTCTPNGKKFQFAEGESYHEDEAKLCKSGFHACEMPLDCLLYYPPATSVYHVCELEGATGEREDDSKVCGTDIKIGARLDIAGLVKAQIDWVQSKDEKTENSKDMTGVASATGNRGVASATGNRGVASATGYRGVASATGYRGVASATGARGTASVTGDWGTASVTGDWGVVSATGYRGAALTTGYKGAVLATGTLGTASATGNWGVALATGYKGIASATGDRGTASATGDRGVASATGYRGVALATGDRGAASATGKASVAMAAGVQGRVMGALGCALFCVERGELEGSIYPIKSVCAGIVDGVNLLPDVWYTCVDGRFVKTT